MADRYTQSSLSVSDGTVDYYDAVSPFVKDALIPRGLQSYCILGKEDLLFLYYMVWLYGSVAMLNELDMIPKGK